MTTEINVQILPAGFGGYLQGILPEDQAILAGAFATSMMQIRNIQNVDPVKFGQVVYSLETTQNMPDSVGTNVPTDGNLAAGGLEKIGLGSGQYGSYTMSDFFGTMTGLPYNLEAIKTGITDLQTSNLANIYGEIYQIVNWGQARATVNYNIDANNNYVITGFSVFDSGGGYTTPPSVTVNGGSGATANATIGTDANNLATYKKVISLNLISGGSNVATIPTVTIAAPPSDGRGSWPARNANLAAQITLANDEIANIGNASLGNKQKAALLNEYYNMTGTSLKIEQRARFIGISPVPAPRDALLNPYPGSLTTFVDSLSDLASSTAPHGAAQSLEMIADLCTTGGQSLIAGMRQERNQQRLQEVGIPLDNNIPDAPDEADQKILSVNGSIAQAVEGVTTPEGEQFTMPAWPATTNCNGDAIQPNATAFFNCSENELYNGTQVLPRTISQILQGDSCPIVTPIGPIVTAPVGNEIDPVIPFNLNADYISATLLPSNYNNEEAIARVIACNCDCWVD